MRKTTLFTLLLAGLIIPRTGLLAQNKQAAGKNQPVKFDDVREKANTYFNQHPSDQKEEDGIYAQYKRWEWFTEQRVMPNGEFPAPGITWNEWKNYARSHSHSIANTASNSGNWSFIGPTTTPGGYEGLGRIACIAFHPTVANTFWIGTPAGGLWKTTDGGTTWTTTTDNTLPVLGVSDIAIDPTNANVMYIATGDGDQGSLSALTGGYWGDTKSVGVLKSTDGGATWNTTGLSFQVQNTILIRRLLIHPTNHMVLIAATSNGVYRTNDGGVTWNQFGNGIYFNDLAFKPGDPSIVYTTTSDFGGNAQVYTSIDTAITFNQSSNFTGAGRIQLGTSAFTPNVVHALCANSSTRGFNGLFVSRNSGTSFTPLYAAGATNLLNNSFDGSGTDGQGEYDLTYLMSPTDTNTLYVGGVNTWKSTDAGKTWALNTMWTANSGQNPGGVITIHADKHFMANDPHNAGTIYQTNDGGIYKTTDGITWTDKSNGLGISQVYRIGTSVTNANLNMTGLQDNGSRKFDTGTWSYASGGDGCECIIDYANPQNMYASYVQGTIYATTDAWATTSTTISANIPGTPTGAWITPYVMDPVSPATLYAGYADVYKTPDMGATWTQISSGLTTSSTDYLKILAVAPSDNQTIYAGTFDSIYVTSNGGTNWKSISGFSMGNKKTYIAINPTNPLMAWVTISRYAAGEKVYKTSDGGTTWTNVSGTLPNLPVNCIVYEKGSNNGLYIGTDIGVFYMNDSMTDWIPFSTGLPNIVVSELEIQYSSKELRAGTFGRGLWKTDLYSLSTGIKENSSNSNAVQVFPNPTKGSFTLNISDFKGMDKANLYNYLGETLKVIDIRTPLSQIDLSTYADGIYYLGLESEHYSHMHRIVKLN